MMDTNDSQIVELHAERFEATQVHPAGIIVSVTEKAA